MTFFTGDSLGTQETVTVAAHCYMPTTFAAVPVDTVTVYLDPILSPDCAATTGHPTAIGSGGGSTMQPATIHGELVWPNGIEFKVAPWDVPIPPGENDDEALAHSPRRVRFRALG